MPDENNAVHGWDELAYVTEETTFGTLEDAVGTDAFEFTEIEFGPTEAAERRNTKDKNNSRGHKAQVTGKLEPMEFTVRGTVRPSGAAGTAPDIGAFLKNGLGTETVNASTSVVYTYADRPTGGLSIMRGEEYGGWAEYLSGCIVQSISFSGGDEELEFEISGMGLTKVSVAAFDIGGTPMNDTDVTTTLTIGADIFRLIGTGQVLVDRADTTEQMQVTAVDYAAGQVTVSRGYNSTTKVTHAANATFVPYFPTQTLAGSPIGEHEGTFTAHTRSVYPTETSFTINTGRTFRPFEKGSQRRRGAAYGEKVTVESSMTVVSDNENMEFTGLAKNFDTGSLDFTYGDTAGSQLQVEAGLTEIIRAPVDIPESELALVEYGFRVYGWNNTDRPIRLTFK